MAPQQSMSLLFHPKKKGKQIMPPPPPKANGVSPTKKAKPKAEDEDEDLKLPDGPFQEFRLLSSALNGWRYDVMKFDSRKPVDIFRWQQPIKLNRKDMRRDEAATNAAPEAVGPMLGPDGKPVIGVDGKMVMVDAEGRPIHANSNNGAGAGSSKDKEKDKGKDKAAAKKRFQRKTRQVFFVPEEVRQLRREERYPWVMEDSSSAQNEVWQGQMEDATKSETHGFFMPAANDVFKFVPAHRWYKFQKRLKHDLPTDTANVESMYTMSQKRDPQQWLASRKGKAPSAATAAMFKGEGESAGAGGSGGQSLGPGGRRLKTVDSGMDHLFEDDEDGEGSRRRKRELGEEGDLDEQVYEEDFADDDEKMEVDENDEEAKETEERLKKEYKTANKQREAGVDESEEEDDSHPASKQSKAMQKLIQKREGGGGGYDSDDEEKNPYATSEEEEEEEEPIILPTASSAIQEQQQKVESRSQTPKPNGTGTPRPSISTNVPKPGSRATSPNLSPNHGGHSLIAKRATSPKAPKPKVPNMSRGNSPLGGQSTVNSRATSPVAMDVDQKVKNLKRKAEDAPGSPVSPDGTPAPTKPKKRKPAPVSLEELEHMLIEWLKINTTKTTRECSTHFAKYIGSQRQEFTAIVRKIAVCSKDGFMVLKSDVLRAARAGSSAPSPAVVSAAPSPAAPSPGA